MEILEYFCRCGYHTTVSTGMMLHLTWPENRTDEHGFHHAERRTLIDRLIVHASKREA